MPDEAVLHHPRARPGEQRIVSERHRRHRAAPQTLLRYESQPQGAASRRTHVIDTYPAQADRAAVGADGLPRERREQFFLTIARYAGDADDFAAAHREVDLAKRGAEGLARGHAIALELEANLARFVRREGRIVQVIAHHQPRETRGRFFARPRRAADSPGAQHRGGIAQDANLLELVTDIKDAHALARKPAQCREE